MNQASTHRSESQVSSEGRSQAFRDPHRFDRLFDIVCPDDVGPVIHGDGCAGERTNETVRRIWLTQNFADERLPRHANQERESQSPQGGKFAQDCTVPFIPGNVQLAEKPNPGIEHDMILGNTRLSGDLQTLLQRRPNPYHWCTRAWYLL